MLPDRCGVGLVRAEINGHTRKRVEGFALPLHRAPIVEENLCRSPVGHPADENAKLVGFRIELRATKLGKALGVAIASSCQRSANLNI